MNIETWYKETVGNDSQNMVAANSGIVPSSLYRQLPDRLSPQTVVKIAHAYGVSAINGLVALGLLSDEDISELVASDSLRDATDQQLIDELARRIDDYHAHDIRNSVFDQPVPGKDEAANAADLMSDVRADDFGILAANDDPNKNVEKTEPELGA